MRDDLQKLWKAGLRPDHAGLAYEVWAPVDATGKVPDDKRDDWLQGVADTQMPDGYEDCYGRWRSLFEDDECSRAEEIELASRLLIGHGNPSPTEVGLTLQHTWGVPIIPGSALKGLLNHYVDAVYGPEKLTGHPMDPALPDAERERARYQGVTWDATGKRIVHGPGEIHRALFGAPAAASDLEFAGQDVGETRGGVIFHDAWMIPEADMKTLPLAADVLTVHQKKYYDSQGRQGPSEYDNPVPVAFLTVRPKTKFLLAVSGPSAWTALAMSLLRDALTEWGVGGKTAAGYGRINSHRKVVADPTTVRQRRAERAEKAAADARAAQRQAILGASKVLPEFRAWLASAKALEQRPRLEKIRQEWLPRLLVLTPEEREEAARDIQRDIKSRKAEENRDELMKDLRQGET